jgi:hypothetical protein
MTADEKKRGAEEEEERKGRPSVKMGKTSNSPRLK